jgi:peptidoglycan hydrolase FlgJ
MQISSLANPAFEVRPNAPKPDSSLVNKASEDDKKTREAFDDFVGQTFYGQMLSAMRKTLDKPAYMFGGRTEEVFQSQLDQVLAEKLSDATADTFTGPMYDLFKLQRVA